MEAAQQGVHKPHRPKHSGPQAKRKKDKTKVDELQTAKQRNPKAFAIQSVNKTARAVRRTADIIEKKHHIPVVDRSPLEPPPIVVAIVGPPKVGKTTLISCLVKNFTHQRLASISGPVTLVSGKKRRLTLLECNNDISSMIDVAKVADLVLLMVDASFGFEMETFEFLNIAQAHGFPKIMGVLTHLDGMKNNKALNKTKKKLKHRFWKEVYQGAKLFYLSGMMHGEYLRREIHNLGRFISVMKFRPLVWRTSHSYILADRMEDLTNPELIRQKEKCDRHISLYGYVRGTPLKLGGSIHLAGCGDFDIKDITFLPDPCPLPNKERKRSLDTRERLIYAPMSGVGGIIYDKDVVYIEMGNNNPKEPIQEEIKPSNELVTSIIGTQQTLDTKMASSQVTLFEGTAPMTSEEVDERERGRYTEEGVVVDGRRRRRVKFDDEEAEIDGDEDEDEGFEEVQEHHQKTGADGTSKKKSKLDFSDLHFADSDDDLEVSVTGQKKKFPVKIDRKTKAEQENPDHNSDQERLQGTHTRTGKGISRQPSKREEMKGSSDDEEDSEYDDDDNDSGSDSDDESDNGSASKNPKSVAKKTWSKQQESKTSQKNVSNFSDDDEDDDSLNDGTSDDAGTSNEDDSTDDGKLDASRKTTMQQDHSLKRKQIKKKLLDDGDDSDDSKLSSQKDQFFEDDEDDDDDGGGGEDDDDGDSTSNDDNDRTLEGRMGLTQGKIKSVVVRGRDESTADNGDEDVINRMRRKKVGGEGSDEDGTSSSDESSNGNIEHRKRQFKDRSIGKGQDRGKGVGKGKFDEKGCRKSDGVKTSSKVKIAESKERLQGRKMVTKQKTDSGVSDDLIEEEEFEEFSEGSEENMEEEVADGEGVEMLRGEEVREDEDESDTDGEMESDQEESEDDDGQLKWKENLTEKAASAFLKQQQDTPNLRKLVYGGVAENESGSDTEELGGLLTVTRPSKDEEKRSRGMDGQDCSAFPVKHLRDWDLEKVRALIADCFVTGKWEENEDAETLLEKDDELYGDFEDLETGEVHKAEPKEEENEEGDVEEGDDESDEGDEEKPALSIQEQDKQERARRMENKRKAKLGMLGGDEEEGPSYFDEWKEEMNQQSQMNRAEFEDMDDNIRTQYEGFRPGMYVRVEVANIPCEFVMNFDPTCPMVLGGLLSSENSIGFVQIRLKKHRWYPKILKTRDPLIFSVGWRRFQTIPLYCIQDHNGRNRLLKYTPEHLHCIATIWGPITPQGTGILAVQSLSGRDPGFRIAATGVILDLDKSMNIVKKLKLTGVPIKIHKNTAFIQGMFNTALEVAKFEGALIRTVSGIRGQIKKASKAPPGAFRASFEDKLLRSDIVFLRSWYQVQLPKFYNPVTTMLLPKEQKGTWTGMRTVGQLRRDNNIPLAVNEDSLYKPIVRKQRKFNRLVIPRKLAKELPFKYRPRQGPRKEGLTIAGTRAVIREPHERKIAALMEELGALYKDKKRKAREDREKKSIENKKKLKAAEENLQNRQKKDKREMFRLLGQIKKNKKF